MRLKVFSPCDVYLIYKYLRQILIKKTQNSLIKGRHNVQTKGFPSSRMLERSHAFLQLRQVQRTNGGKHLEDAVSPAAQRTFAPFRCEHVLPGLFCAALLDQFAHQFGRAGTVRDGISQRVHKQGGVRRPKNLSEPVLCKHSGTFSTERQNLRTGAHHQVISVADLWPAHFQDHVLELVDHAAFAHPVARVHLLVLEFVHSQAAALSQDDPLSGVALDTAANDSLHQDVFG